MTKKPPASPATGAEPTAPIHPRPPDNDTTPEPQQPTRKRIMLAPSIPLGDAFDAAIEALATLPRLFCREGSLVTVDPVTAAISPVTQTSLAEMITRVCEVWSQQGDKIKPVAVPPPALLRGILQRREYPGIRPLREVLRHPAILPDGSVIIKPGYRAGIVLAKHGLQLEIKDQPTKADAEQALRMLEALVGDYHFAKKMHLAAWISALLAALSSAAHVGNMPATVITADKKGTGKTQLVQLIAKILYGKLVGTEKWGDEAEIHKMITTALKERKRLMLIDNVTQEIHSDSLNILLTSRRWRARGLHSHSAIDEAHSLQVYITGNNLKVASDATRRVIGVRLKSRVQHPQHRTDFRNPDLLAYALEHRAELMSAALTILRAYHVAGRPRAKELTLGSYEQWVDWAVGPLAWLGRPNPILTQLEFAAGPASDESKLEALVTAWLASIGEEAITAADLRDALRARAGDGKYRTLLDALRHAGIETHNAVKLGLRLRDLVGHTTEEGWGIVATGKTRGDSHLWAVRQTPRTKSLKK